MNADETDLLIFERTQNCQFIPFPVTGRIGRIREVASKIRNKHSERHASYYRKQVTEALTWQLEKIHVSKVAQNEFVTAFWVEVEREILRQSAARPSNPSGTT